VRAAVRAAFPEATKGRAAVDGGPRDAASPSCRNAFVHFPAVFARKPWRAPYRCRQPSPADIVCGAAPNLHETRLRTLKLPSESHPLVLAANDFRCPRRKRCTSRHEQDTATSRSTRCTPAQSRHAADPPAPSEPHITFSPGYDPPTLCAHALGCILGLRVLALPTRSRVAGPSARLRHPQAYASCSLLYFTSGRIDPVLRLYFPPEPEPAKKGEEEPPPPPPRGSCPPWHRVAARGAVG